MFERFTTIYGQRIPSYSIILLIGVIASIAWVLMRTPKEKRLATLDTLLIALVSAVIIGRMVHVAVSWAYFSENMGVIWRIHQSGGINWHGAVIGAIITIISLGHWRNIDTDQLLDSFAMPIAVMALSGWWACSVAHCAYGVEIERMADYPAWMTWDANNIYGLQAPRFAVQPIGMWLSRFLIVLIFVLHWREWAKNYRLWIALIFVSFISFGLGFMRGDASKMFYELHIEQWLDVGIISIAMIAILATMRQQLK